MKPEPGGPGGLTGRSVNPIPTGEGRLSPPITTGTPQCFSPSGITVVRLVNNQAGMYQNINVE